MAIEILKACVPSHPQNSNISEKNITCKL